jgi:hypothetical protein
VSTVETWSELLRGAMSFGFKAPAMPPYELFSAMVFAGAGGTANLFYAFYVRDKGWGMGVHMPVVVNPLRGREERTADTGFRIAAGAENIGRWRAWYRHLTIDQMLFFFFLNTFTILLFILGALAVLHAQGIVPDQENLVWDEAEILAHGWGGIGRTLFLLVGVACLYSTQLTLVDGVARSCADILHTNFEWARRHALNTWYGRIAAAWIAVGIGLTYLWQAIPAWVFLLSAGFFGGIAMALYTPLTLYINLRFLPPMARPSRLRVAILVAVSIFYGVFAIVATINVVQALLLGPS